MIKEINLLIAGEDEVGNAEAGSRASSEVAQSVREIRAQELSELLCSTLNESLIRWIVDLNFGTNVVAPKIRRHFVTEDKSTLTMTDVGTMIEKVGFRPTREWIESTFKVELEEPEETQVEGPLQEIPAPEAEAESEEETTPTETKGETTEAPAEEENADLDALLNQILGE